MNFRPFLAIIVSGWILYGCDEKAPPPPPPAPAVSTAATKPTSNPALATAPRKPLRLGPAPLSVDVPDGWSVKMDPAVGTIIEGVSPNGPVTIYVGKRSNLSAEIVNTIKESATTQPADPALGGIQPVHESNGVVVIESGGLHGNPTTAPTSDAIDWRFGIYFPSQDRYSKYDLAFWGLTRGHYQADREFLRSIMASLKLIPESSLP